MATQKGRLLEIAVEDTPGAGTYTPVAGMRAKQLTYSRPSTVTTDDQSPGQWEERETGFSIKTMQISGNGLFKSHATQRKIFNALWNDSGPLKYRMTVPGLGVFVGNFATDSNDFAGNHDGELSFSTTFMSAGEIAFTPSA
jgi:TP901-1 family phage major tail protein